MAYESYAEFLDALEQAGELTRITEPLATELEITELADREMKKPGGGQALLIEQPTVNGRVSPHPVAINMMGSVMRVAMALGAESVDAVAAELGSLIQAKPPTGIREPLALLGQALTLRHAKPKRVKSGPCKEVIHRFDDPASRTEPWPSAPNIDDSSTLNPSPPSLLDLPILKCWPLDGGRFLTLPCVVTRDPDTGDRNLGLYRMQVYDGQSTGMHCSCRKSPRGTDAATTRPASACRWPFSSAATRCSPFAPQRRYRTGWMSSCAPAICAASRSSW